jgi:AcrR family transcriptional regulator
MFTERQSEIMHTAIQLIAVKGIQGLTMKNLSKEIGISEPAIYRHYENKIEILVSILDFFATTSRQVFEQEMHSTEASLTKIERIFENHFSAFAATPALAAVIFSEEIFRNEPVLTSKIKEVMQHNSMAIRTILLEGQERGEISKALNTEDLALIIMGSLRLLIKQWQMADYSYHLPERGAQFFVTLKKLLSV